MAQDRGPGSNIQTDRRFVQHQNARLVQQCAGDFHPPHLAAGQLPHRVPGTIRQVDLLQRGACALPCVAATDPVQGGVIQQVVDDRQIEVERARLEHHAQAAQRFARLARDAMTQHVDRSLLRVVKPCDEREQRGLAGAIQAQQRSEARLRHGEADILQRLVRTVGMAHAAHFKRRERWRRRIGHGRRSGVCDDRCAHCGDTTTPQGRRPTWIDFTTSSDATSITEMSFESPLVVSRYFWSGVNAICQTRCPTSRYLRTL